MRMLCDSHPEISKYQDKHASRDNEKLLQYYFILSLSFSLLASPILSAPYVTSAVSKSVNDD